MSKHIIHRGTSLIETPRNLLYPYAKGPTVGWAFSYERGTPVLPFPRPTLSTLASKVNLPRAITFGAK